ncbi:MAG TPA: UrcA family protein [Allosphingosinicella sp.]|jgi:UrcA family protein|nr:UrcA family protein [Allosphingosinicella sp.]
MTRTDFKFAALAAIMALAVTGATFAAATPASGAELVVNGTVPTARVHYADLDLRSQAGVARLEHRVAAAADRLCIGDGVESLADRLTGMQCRDAAIATAVPQVRSAIERASTAQASASRAITLTLGH